MLISHRTAEQHPPWAAVTWKRSKAIPKLCTTLQTWNMSLQWLSKPSKIPNKKYKQLGVVSRPATTSSDGVSTVAAYYYGKRLSVRTSLIWRFHFFDWFRQTYTHIYGGKCSLLLTKFDANSIIQTSQYMISCYNWREEWRIPLGTGTRPFHSVPLPHYTSQCASLVILAGPAIWPWSFASQYDFMRPNLVVWDSINTCMLSGMTT